MLVRQPISSRRLSCSVRKAARRKRGSRRPAVALDENHALESGGLFHFEVLRIERHVLPDFVLDFPIEHRGCATGQFSGVLKSPAGRQSDTAVSSEVVEAL